MKKKTVSQVFKTATNKSILAFIRWWNSDAHFVAGSWGVFLVPNGDFQSWNLKTVEMDEPLRHALRCCWIWLTFLWWKITNQLLFRKTRTTGHQAGKPRNSSWKDQHCALSVLRSVDAWSATRNVSHRKCVVWRKIIAINTEVIRRWNSKDYLVTTKRVIAGAFVGTN